MAISICMSDNIEFFTIITLVDITNTGVTRNNPECEKSRDQQRNWETVLQTIGLRAQPIIIDGPYSDTIEEDIVTKLFGEMHSGQQRIWIANIGHEHRDVYAANGDPLALLKSDFNQVPIVSGLDETARFILPIFYSSGAIKNIALRPGRINIA